MENTQRNLDFKLIQPQLSELLIATGNWVEWSWPGKRPAHGKTHEGAHALLLGLVRSTENTWRTSAFLCADIPHDPARREEFVLSVSPLSRTVLEALCTMIFVFGNLEKRVASFYRSGWREVKEEEARIIGRYGAQPEWQDYIKELGALLGQTRAAWGITDDEAEGRVAIPRFPIPDRMINDKELAADRRQQIQYLLDWYYRKMSQDAHLSWPGLARRAAIFLPAVTSEDRSRILPKARADILSTLVALCLAVVSEIEVECRFGMATKARYVWTILGDFDTDTKALYEMFYRDKLVG